MQLRDPHSWQPPTDLYETKDALIVRAEIAGMRDGTLAVSINGKELTITGVREYPSHGGAYHQMEVRYGEFRSDVRLPVLVDEDKVEASYTDGFLTVVMPKQGVHRVKVQIEKEA